MSRAININAPLTEVQDVCRKHGATVSAIEGLASGGTRVVLMNIEATETIKRAFGRKVLTGGVSRIPLRTWKL